MKSIKKYSGYIWMILAPVMIAFMIYQAYSKISIMSEGIARTNTILQWIIILLIFIPICIAFFIFGKYAASGEFDNETYPPPQS